VQGQEVLLLMSSNVTASQLLVDANQSLPNLPSVGSFSNASSGWIYYNSSSTLMVKFVANGASTLRLLSYTEPVPAPTPFPTRTLLAVLIALVATELVAFTLIAFRHQRSRAPGRERGDVPAR